MTKDLQDLELSFGFLVATVEDMVLCWHDFTMALFFLWRQLLLGKLGDDGKCSPHWNDLGQFGELN